jgi:uncharacterized protein YndB with AHSA1/START domain/limonene-1,2-epoxide hydrolase
MTKPTRDAGYEREVMFRATRERAFPAVTTIAGLRGWWTPIVAGTIRPGGQLTFGFEGLDEAIVMEVDEVKSPSCVRWTCLERTGAPEWSGTTIQFEFRDEGSEDCVLSFAHTGLAAEGVEPGWDRFLASLSKLIETGRGEPYGPDGPDALEVARAYHAAWTSHDFDTARRYLAGDLETEVPINTYTGRDDFAEAVERTAGLAERVDLLAEFGSGTEALLLYDMQTQPLGRFRVAEHFTVDDGLIRRIRHVHDTVAFRGMT